MADGRDAVATLLQLEHSVRRAESSSELYYLLCNQLRQLAQFDVAILFRVNERNRLKVETVSDHVSVDRTAPFVSWFENLAKQENTVHEQGPRVLDTKAWSELKRTELAEFTPESLLWVPLTEPSTKRLIGVLLLTREAPWTDATTLPLLAHFAATASHAIAALDRHSFFKAVKRSLAKNRVLHAVLGGIFLLMFVPVRLSVVAPAEVVSKQPFLVTSGLNGAVRSIEVMPGDQVSLGTPLVKFDDTQFVSDLEIAQKSLLRAQAELRTTERGGFVDARVKSRLAELEASVELKRVELASAEKQLSKTQIVADREGVVVLNDPQEWVGRPVTIGEKIMSIADPDQVEVRIMLPVQDAIVLNHQEPMRLFLDSDPLSPVEIKFVYATYEPEKTPGDILANKVIAEISETSDTSPPRIGMRGTAKLYGEQVSLFYYLFRRPITAVRQWVGW